MWDYIENTFERYIITTDAKIFDTYNHIELKPKIYKSGYVYMGIYVDGEYKTCALHRLMCQTFLLNPENKPQVNHKDAIKWNNLLENLEWATAHENMMHVRANKLNPRSMSACVIDDCGNILNTFVTTKELSDFYNVNNGVAYYCCTGKQDTCAGIRARFYNDTLDEYIKTRFDNGVAKKKGRYKKQFICVNTGEIYTSQAVASKDTGVLQSKISLILRGKEKESKGYRFEYL
jgi:hypothetical protein